MTMRCPAAADSTDPYGEFYRVQRLASSAAGNSAASDAGQERVAMVQGASRGLGLEFVRQLLERPGQKVVAACRHPSEAQALQGLRDAHPGRVLLVPVDVTDAKSVEDAAVRVASEHSHLDLLVNTTGLLHIPGVMVPETSYTRVDADAMLLSFQTNAIGNFLVCKAFAPLLIAAEAHSGASMERPAKLINLSARVGSISDNGLGGWYSYRASKAALNQLTKTMSLEIARRKQKVAMIALHPGTCDTDLSKPFQRNVRPDKLFTRELAVKQLLGVIDGMNMGDNGKFLAWDGQGIEW